MLRDSKDRNKNKQMDIPDVKRSLQNQCLQTGINPGAFGILISSNRRVCNITKRKAEEIYIFIGECCRVVRNV